MVHSVSPLILPPARRSRQASIPRFADGMAHRQSFRMGSPADRARSYRPPLSSTAMLVQEPNAESPITHRHA